ncbi:hypothetical protein G7054_g14474 [Neopestalotiopsis clavispora]|nr:hypothetical protein G7054_g14474 [Neopestalotiopsis clavispora]
MQSNAEPQPPIVNDDKKLDSDIATIEKEQVTLGIASNAPNSDEVTWDGPDDPSNPRNWSVSKRAYTIGVFLKDLQSNDTFAGTLVVSIEVLLRLLGFGFGPLFFAPMSELYDRHILYVIANMAFCLVTVGCALALSLNSLVALHFLQGLAASCSSSHGGGTIADLVPIRRRRAVKSGYTYALLFGVWSHSRPYI